MDNCRLSQAGIRINPRVDREVVLKSTKKSLPVLSLLPGLIAHPPETPSSQVPNLKALPFMQVPRRSGLLEPWIETTFQDRLNPNLLGSDRIYSHT